MEVGWGGEGGMVGNIGLLASHLSHLTKSHRPQKDILPASPSLLWFFNYYGLTKIGISHLVLVGCFDSFKVLDVLIVDE